MVCATFCLLMTSPKFNRSNSRTSAGRISRMFDELMHGQSRQALARPSSTSRIHRPSVWRPTLEPKTSLMFTSSHANREANALVPISGTIQALGILAKVPVLFGQNLYHLMKLASFKSTIETRMTCYFISDNASDEPRNERSWARLSECLEHRATGWFTTGPLGLLVPLSHNP